MNTMRQNRRAPRKEFLARIRVSWQSSGVGQNEWGMIQDKSVSGLGIRLPKPISVDSLIAVKLGSSTSFAVVRHCAKDKGQFFLGVEYCQVEKEIPSAHTSTGPLIESAPEEDKVQQLPPIQEETSEPAAQEMARRLRSGFEMMTPPQTRSGEAAK